MNEGTLILVTKVDFDNSENRYPEIEKHYGIFLNENAVKEHFGNIGEIRQYRGWDGSWYPQFKSTKVRDFTK